jgi:small subunit ribosomal protein S9
LSTGNKEEAVVEQSKNESVEKAVEPWMNEEVEYFFRGRSRLAAAMDSSAHDMSEDEVKSALKYLLPSKLTASDARPFLKHPFDIYPKRKETLFSKDRPLEAGFYTGSPSFANILHAIYSYYLDATSGTPSKGKTEDLDLMSKKMRWNRKEEMEDLIQESLTLSQHEHLINILKKVEEHLGTTHSSFLDQFRKPITPFAAQPTLQQSHGNALSTAVGKRKSAVAYVKLERGSGIITVNGKTFIDYFPRVQDR